MAKILLTVETSAPANSATVDEVIRKALRLFNCHMGDQTPSTRLASAIVDGETRNLEAIDNSSLREYGSLKRPWET